MDITDGRKKGYNGKKGRSYRKGGGKEGRKDITEGRKTGYNGKKDGKKTRKASKEGSKGKDKKKAVAVVMVVVIVKEGRKAMRTCEEGRKEGRKVKAET